MRHFNGKFGLFRKLQPQERINSSFENAIGLKDQPITPSSYSRILRGCL